MAFPSPVPLGRAVSALQPADAGLRSAVEVNPSSFQLQVSGLLSSNRKVTNANLDTRIETITGTVLDHGVLEPLALTCGRSLERSRDAGWRSPRVL